MRNKANERKASVENGSHGSLSNSGNSNGTISPMQQLEQPVDTKLGAHGIVPGFNSNTYSINGILGIEHKKYQQQQQQQPQRQNKRKNPDGKYFVNIFHKMG